MTSLSNPRRAYALVLLGTGSYLFLMFIWFSVPAYLSVIIEDIDLTGTQAGLVVGAVPLTYIPLALVSGVVVDRVGPGWSLGVGVLVYGLAQIGRSLATEFSHLFVFTVGIGVGATAITFGLPKLVSLLFPPEKTGFPSSLYLVGASAGSAAVFGLGRPVFGPVLGGWRPLFFWSGVCACVYALLWLLVARHAGVDTHQSIQDSTFSLASIRQDLTFILSHRELQLVVVIGTMYLFTSHTVQGWLPAVLESRGFSATVAGQTTSIFVVMVAVGIFLVPGVADRFAARREALIVCGLLTSCGTAMIVFDGSGLLTIAGVVIAGVGTGGLSPLLRAIPPALSGIGARLTGTAVGFIFAVGEIGGFFGPFLVGFLHDVTDSFLPGLVLLVAAGFVIVLAGEALRRNNH